MIARPSLIESVRQAMARSRVVALLGPRQCGKTTLAGQLLAPESPNYFDLEDLRLERIAVVYPGVKRYPLAERVEAVPLEALVHRTEGLFPE